MGNVPSILWLKWGGGKNEEMTPLQLAFEVRKGGWQGSSGGLGERKLCDLWQITYPLTINARTWYRKHAHVTED